MAVLNNGLQLIGVGSDTVQMIKGLVLLIAVAVDVYNKSQGRPSITGFLTRGLARDKNGIADARPDAGAQSGVGPTPNDRAGLTPNGDRSDRSVRRPPRPTDLATRAPVHRRPVAPPPGTLRRASSTLHHLTKKETSACANSR